MGNRRILAVAALLVVLFVAYVGYWMSRGGIPWYGAVNDGSPGTEGTPVSPRARGETPRDQDTNPPPVERVRKVEPTRVAYLRGTIREALTRALRETSTATSPSEGGSDGDGDGDKAGPGRRTAELEPEYIKEAMQDLKPILAECYDLALADDPKLPEGKLVVEFTVIGDQDLGAVIESAMIAADSELRHPILHECVRETMYSLELPPPDRLGELLVRYPFNFSH